MKHFQNLFRVWLIKMMPCLKPTPDTHHSSSKKWEGIGLCEWGCIIERCLLRLMMGFCGSGLGVMRNMIA